MWRVLIQFFFDRYHSSYLCEKFDFFKQSGQNWNEVGTHHCYYDQTNSIIENIVYHCREKKNKIIVEILEEEQKCNSIKQLEEHFKNKKPTFFLSESLIFFLNLLKETDCLLFTFLARENLSSVDRLKNTYFSKTEIQKDLLRVKKKLNDFFLNLSGDKEIEEKKKQITEKIFSLFSSENQEIRISLNDFLRNSCLLFKYLLKNYEEEQKKLSILRLFKNNGSSASAFHIREGLCRAECLYENRKKEALLHFQNKQNTNKENETNAILESNPNNHKVDELSSVPFSSIDNVDSNQNTESDSNDVCEDLNISNSISNSDHIKNASNSLINKTIEDKTTEKNLQISEDILIFSENELEENGMNFPKKQNKKRPSTAEIDTVIKPKKTKENKEVKEAEKAIYNDDDNELLVTITSPTNSSINIDCSTRNLVEENEHSSQKKTVNCLQTTAETKENKTEEEELKKNAISYLTEENSPKKKSKKRKTEDTNTNKDYRFTKQSKETNLANETNDQISHKNKQPQQIIFSGLQTLTTTTEATNIMMEAEQEEKQNKTNNLTWNLNKPENNVTPARLSWTPEGTKEESNKQNNAQTTLTPSLIISQPLIHSTPNEKAPLSSRLITPTPNSRRMSKSTFSSCKITKRPWLLQNINKQKQNALNLSGLNIQSNSSTNNETDNDSKINHENKQEIEIEIEEESSVAINNNVNHNDLLNLKQKLNDYWEKNKEICSREDFLCFSWKTEFDKKLTSIDQCLLELEKNNNNNNDNLQKKAKKITTETNSFLQHWNYFLKKIHVFGTKYWDDLKQENENLSSAYRRLHKETEDLLTKNTELHLELNTAERKEDEAKKLEVSLKKQLENTKNKLSEKKRIEKELKEKLKKIEESENEIQEWEKTKKSQKETQKKEKELFKKKLELFWDKKKEDKKKLDSIDREKETLETIETLAEEHWVFKDGEHELALYAYESIFNLFCEIRKKREDEEKKQKNTLKALQDENEGYRTKCVSLEEKISKLEKNKNEQIKKQEEGLAKTKASHEEEKKQIELIQTKTEKKSKETENRYLKLHEEQEEQIIEEKKKNNELEKALSELWDTTKKTIKEKTDAIALYESDIDNLKKELETLREKEKKNPTNKSLSLSAQLEEIEKTETINSLNLPNEKNKWLNVLKDCVIKIGTPLTTITKNLEEKTPVRSFRNLVLLADKKISLKQKIDKVSFFCYENKKKILVTTTTSFSLLWIILFFTLSKKNKNIE